MMLPCQVPTVRPPYPRPIARKRRSKQPPMNPLRNSMGTYGMRAVNLLPMQQQKWMIGEQLYPKIQLIAPRLAGKITGMLLEAMSSSELLVLLSDRGELINKICEARAALPKDYRRWTALHQVNPNL